MSGLLDGKVALAPGSGHGIDVFDTRSSSLRMGG
jgi:hypothetical protein